MKKKMRHTSIICLPVISSNEHMFTSVRAYWTLLRALLGDGKHFYHYFFTIKSDVTPEAA